MRSLLVLKCEDGPHGSARYRASQTVTAVRYGVSCGWPRGSPILQPPFPGGQERYYHPLRCSATLHGRPRRPSPQSDIRPEGRSCAASPCCGRSRVFQPRPGSPRGARRSTRFSMEYLGRSPGRCGSRCCGVFFVAGLVVRHQQVDPPVLLEVSRQQPRPSHGRERRAIVR